MPNKQAFTLKDIASEFDVTQQRISQVIKELNLSDAVDRSSRPYTIPEDAAEQIRSKLLKRPSQKPPKAAHQSNRKEQQLIDVLQKQLEVLQGQLEEKDKQIASLIKANEALSASAAINAAADKKRALLSDGSQKPLGFFSRFFHRD